MEIDLVESKFSSYLISSGDLNNIVPFTLSYINLLSIFEKSLDDEVKSVIKERKKQIIGEDYCGDRFDHFLILFRDNLERDLRDGTEISRAGVINNLLLCALLDTEEPDFYYLTEPIFDFVRVMEVPIDTLIQILETEFIGFKFNDLK